MIHVLFIMLRQLAMGAIVACPLYALASIVVGLKIAPGIIYASLAGWNAVSLVVVLVCWADIRAAERPGAKIFSYIKAKDEMRVAGWSFFVTIGISLVVVAAMVRG